MVDRAEDILNRFYNSNGWQENGGVTEDAKRWEDLRNCAKEYVSKCRLRVLRHIPERGDNILDMASGPIQYPEYLEYSKNFNKRYCVDLSSKALEEAEKKIGKHGVFLHGSFFNIPLEDNFFDCAISLHTIYHMDKDRQEEAVRKLIRVTKPGKPVIIVYSNPAAIGEYFVWPIKKVKKNFKIRNGIDFSGKNELYFHAHPLCWWKRFENIGEIKKFPWRSFKADQQKLLMPDNFIGKLILNCLYRLEDSMPKFFVRYFRYPMVVLTKR